MSNDAHLDKLAEGVAAWDLWRELSPSVRPDLSGADLRAKDLSGIELANARLDGADLTGVNLEGANLYDAHFNGATLVDANLKAVDMRGSDFESAIVDGVKFDRRMKCLGARVERCTGNPRFVRHVLEADYIEAFAFEHQALAAIWGITSMHSRSFSRAAVVAVALLLIFATVYLLLPGMLHWPDPSGHTGYAPPHWFQPVYYSAAVFTTLGADTIYPSNTAGEIVTTIEVVLGYLWLGYLVSILAQRATARFQ